MSSVIVYKWKVVSAVQSTVSDTADCKSLATSKLNSYWNQEEGHAGAGKIIRFICGKSIVVFHCSSFADFCNLL